MRLNVYIAKSGTASRRKADILIKNGRVEVNGDVVREPYFMVSEDDHVKVKGRSIALQEFVYIVFNKPEGVTCTRYDRFAGKTIIDCFPENIRQKGIFPVGRLDRDSSGLIILTNDGNLCYRMTHPKFEIEKEYLVKIKGRINTADCNKAGKGLEDKGDLLKVKEIRILRATGIYSICNVVICEGKKRHLRRIFRRLGFEVTELKRIRIGRLILGNLKKGDYKLFKKEKIYANVDASAEPKPRPFSPE